MTNTDSIKSLLEFWYHKTNQIGFIEFDPISIPHRFQKKQDIEISGFFAAIMAWGNRKTIIQKSEDLLNRMDNKPHDFVTQASDKDLKQLIGFKHRTLNDTDVLFLIDFLKHWYTNNQSLEQAFSVGMSPTDATVEQGLVNFYNLIFNREITSVRTQKHIASPAKKSACKRLNMYLRWMVRKDSSKVDFGIWGQIKMNQLVCPLDVHVVRVANQLGLMEGDVTNWNKAVELTNKLREYDPKDPVKYDFALFGMGVSNEWT